MVENTFCLPSLIAKMGTGFRYAIGVEIWLLQFPRIAKYGFGKPIDYAIGVSLKLYVCVAILFLCTHTMNIRF
jgi:hypothetical protein